MKATPIRAPWLAVLVVAFVAAAGYAATGRAPGPAAGARARASANAGANAMARADAQPGGWEALEPGLALGTFAIGSNGEHATLHVLRIDPAHFRFHLLNASAPGEGENHTAKEWCARRGWVACINAAMYRDDQKTAVGHMESRGHVNNAGWNADNDVLAFDPRDAAADAALPLREVTILDRTCDDAKNPAAHWKTLVQSIRMLDCHGETAWAKQARRWSTAAIGMDRDGNVLFLHARDALPVHDFVEGVRALPLHVSRLMYVEGGPEAQLSVHSGARAVELVGSYETGFWENDGNREAWPVPNVIAVERKGN